MSIDTTTSLIAIQDEEAGKVRISVLKGLNCKFYTLTSESGYEIPSPLYYTNSADLVLQPWTFDLASPFLVLITTSTPPVLLYFAATCTPYSASDSHYSGLLILAVALGTSLPAIFATLIVAVICKKRAHKRRQVAQEFSIVPPSYNTQETHSDLEPAFPVQVFSALQDPICTTCIVCMEAFTAEAEVRALPCGHVYHGVCLEELFRRVRKCGVCNREYPSATKETVRLFLLTDVLRTEPNESTLNISSP